MTAKRTKTNFKSVKDAASSNSVASNSVTSAESEDSLTNSVSVSNEPFLPEFQGDEVVEIDGIHYEAQSLCGLVSIEGESYASYAANRVNMTEVKNASGRFVYNYFTSDERVRTTTGEANDKILNLDTDFSDEILFQLRNDRLPRYVALSFTPPKTYGLIKKVSVGNTISDNLSKIFIEGATSNSYFTGLEFVDTGKEKELYTTLNSSIFFTDVANEKDSQLDAAEKLLEAIGDDGGLFGKNKSLIKESMSNMQAEGYTLAPTDVSREIAAMASDPIAKQSFSVQFNNLTFSELVKSATRIPDTVFQDEFRGVEGFAETVRANILSSISATEISDATYEMTAQAIDLRPIGFDSSRNGIPNMGALSTPGSGRDNLESVYADYPVINLAGYMIQKYELNPDETVSFLGTLYSDNPEGLYILDKEVKYGAVYIYKIRTIYEVETLVTSVSFTPNSSELTQLCIAKLLVASEGKIVDVSCVETTPPPPPVNLRVGFNYRQKLPFLSWQFPVNPQRDIKRFQLFKRFKISEPYTLIAEYDFDNSEIRQEPAAQALDENKIFLPKPMVNFLDLTYVEGEKPIYTIAAVDAHGMSSNYGAQIQIEYNRYTNKIKTTIISRSDAPKPYPNLLINEDSFKDAIKVSGYERMRVFFDPEYYRVFKKQNANATSAVSRSLNFLRVNPDKATYNIHMINLDLQKDKIVGIKIADKSGTPLNASATEFSVANTSFEFGVGF
jgi:hypothetical protein